MAGTLAVAQDTPQGNAPLQDVTQSDNGTQSQTDNGVAIQDAQPSDTNAAQSDQQAPSEVDQATNSAPEITEEQKAAIEEAAEKQKAVAESAQKKRDDAIIKSHRGRFKVAYATIKNSPDFIEAQKNLLIARQKFMKEEQRLILLEDPSLWQTIREQNEREKGMYDILKPVEPDKPIPVPSK